MSSVSRKSLIWSACKSFNSPISLYVQCPMGPLILLQKLYTCKLLSGIFIQGFAGLNDPPCNVEHPFNTIVVLVFSAVVLFVKRKGPFFNHQTSVECPRLGWDQKVLGKPESSWINVEPHKCSCAKKQGLHYISISSDIEGQPCGVTSFVQATDKESSFPVLS